MSIIDFIKENSMRLRVYVGAGKIRNLNGETELFIKAKIGAEFEKVLANAKRPFSSSICRDLPPEINDIYCNGCEWQNVCKLRKEE